MAVRQTIASANNRTARLRRHRLLVSRDLEAAEGVGQKKSSSPSFRPASLDLATRSASAAQEAASQAFRSSCGLRSSPASDFKANFALSGSRVGSGGAVKRVGARTAEVRGSNPLSSTGKSARAAPGGPAAAAQPPFLCYSAWCQRTRHGGNPEDRRRSWLRTLSATAGSQERTRIARCRGSAA